jgi:hypothetical protein
MQTSEYYREFISFELTEVVNPSPNLRIQKLSYTNDTLETKSFDFQALQYAGNAFA